VSPRSTPDLVAFGEAMVRLTPPGHEPLETAGHLDVAVAGAELNTAVGVARLGHTAAWLSRIPNDALGRLVEGRARAAGVDTTLLQRCDGERQALMFLERGAAPRPSRVSYDRARSAFAQLDPNTIEWPSILDGARCFHTSAITIALSPGCREAVARGLESARAAGCRTSFDLNLRTSLIAADELAEAVAALAPDIDTLIASTGDARAVFGSGEDPAETAAALAGTLGIEQVAVSARSERGEGRQARVSAVFDAGRGHVAESPPFETIDPLGGGDAFAAGIIHGALIGDVGRGLEVGGAMAALKQTIPGDFALVTPADVEAALAGGGMSTLR
jgi:2-dehydro-3-deoxygluconokinase